MATRFKIVIFMILLGAAGLALVGWTTLERIDSNAKSSAQFEREAQCRSASDRLAFAAILDLMADNFATPPFPDPNRQKAVDGMRAVADAFRTTKTPTCPK